MKLTRLGPMILALLPALAVAGTIDTLWTRLYDGPGASQLNTAADMVVDTTHNRIYVCGSGEASQWPAVTNMLTACYDLTGTLLWSQSYGGNIWSEDDMAHALAVDSAGSVYVAGVTYNAAPRGADISWMKYDSAGNAVWVKKTLWPYDDAAFDIALGPGGVAYIAGAAYDSLSFLSAYTILKVSCATGDTIWTRRYVLDTLARESKVRGRDFHPSFFADFSDWDNCATAVAVGADSNVVVTGFGLHRITDLEWWTMKLRPSGDTLWRRSNHNPNTIQHDADAAFDLALSRTDDIYLCGFDYFDDGMTSQGYNYAVARLNSAGTVQNWRSLNIGGYDGDEYAASITLDNATPQNVYVTGMLSWDNDIICTNRFSSTLVSRWGAAGAIYGTDDAYGYRVNHNQGRVYVTGLHGSNTVILGYTENDPPGGVKDTLWAYHYHSPDRLEDFGSAVAATDTGRIYFAGQADRSGGWQSLVLGRLGYANRDLRLDTIYAPRGTFNVGDTVTPRCRVANIGTDSAFYRAHVVIGTVFRESTAVLGLRAGETAHVAFPRWTASQLGSLTVKCSVATTGDPDLANNSKEAAAIVGYRDVGCTRIVAPTGAVPLGTVVTPQAWIRNWGSPAQVFRVLFKVSDGYADTVNNVAVPPSDSVLVSADPWTASASGSFAATCSTMLSGDQQPANDRATSTGTVTAHDIGVTRIIEPAAVIDSGVPVVPRALARNFGTFTEPVAAALKIGSDYSSWASAPGVAPGDSAELVFDEWTPETYDTLIALCWTSLPDDANPHNDSASSVVVVRYADAAALAVEAPTGTIDSGAPVVPRVRVANNGNATEVILVGMAIEDALCGRPDAASKDRDDVRYEEYIEATLLPGRDSVISLPAWSASPIGDFRVRAGVYLDGDLSPRNDSAFGTCRVIPAPHDVGITAVIAPSGTVDSGSTVTPRAVLANFTPTAELVPVRLTIGAGYVADTSVSLAGGTTDTVRFRVWTAIEPGAHSVECYSSLSSDTNSANDTARTQVTVTRPPHDVGVTVILAPVGTVDSGTVVTPMAAVRNHTATPETVPVRLTVGPSYVGDTTVALSGNSTVAVSFPQWTASPNGTHPVLCFARLSTDTNPANDTAYGQVTVQAVRHDVGITAILAPSDTVDSGASVTPTCLLRNYAALNERVPVTFLIGSSYRVDTTWYLNPRTEDTIRFPRWTAGPVGTHEVLCYSALTGDADPTNDTARAEVTVLPPHAVAEQTLGLPRSFALGGVRPNPFSRQVTVVCAVPQAVDVEVVVYDAAGNSVRRLLDRPLPVGSHTVTWNGRDARGRPVPEGIYYVRATGGGFSATGKLVLQR